MRNLTQSVWSMSSNSERPSLRNSRPWAVTHEDCVIHSHSYFSFGKNRVESGVFKIYLGEREFYGYRIPHKSTGGPGAHPLNCLFSFAYLER